MSDSAYTILIAEDDDSIRHALTDVLTASGYEVLALEEGLAAIRAVRERNFDLALLDVAMPGADGFRVLQVMSAERPHPGSCSPASRPCCADPLDTPTAAPADRREFLTYIPRRASLGRGPAPNRLTVMRLGDRRGRSQGYRWNSSFVS